MYWIGGASPARDDGEGTDFAAAALGHLTITPLKVDLSDFDALAPWAELVAALPAPAVLPAAPAPSAGPSGP